MRPRFVLLLFVTVLAAAGCGSPQKTLLPTASSQAPLKGAEALAPIDRGSSPAAPLSTPRPGELIIAEEADLESPFPYVAGQIYSPGRGAPKRTLPLPVTAVPVENDGAVLSPDGRFVLYGAALRRQTPGPARSDATQMITPTLRLLDLHTGADTLFEEGARSPAWAAWGIAYVKGERAAVPSERPYVGRVMVRSSPQSPARAWTEEPGGYGGLVWARDRLLAYRLNIRPYTWAREEILAFDGPGRPRSLGRAAADLIALSPNGELALLSGPDQQAPQMGAVPAVARVVRVVDGSDVARLTPDPALARLYEGGVWIGDRVLTLGDNASVGATHPVVRPIVLRVTGGRIEVERFYLFPRHPTYQGPVGGIFARVRQPRFVDEAETRLGMWYRFGYSRSRYLECDLETGRCVLGSPATDMAGLGWPFLLENLSRPLGL